MTTTPSSVVLAASATFVEQLYARFLSRSAGAAEVEYWARMIASGTLNAAEVSASFLASAEFQQAVDPVVRLYFTAFGRIPDAGGLKFWSGVASGHSAHEIGAAFASSAEFDQLYGKVSDEAFLDTLYHNAFKRAPDAGGKQFWLDLLAHGESRADIVVAFSHSDEMTGAMGNTVRAVEEYFGVHAVAPTADQVAAALATLDPVALLTKLYASDAYTGADVPFLSRAGVVADGYVKGATVTMTVTETVNGVVTTRTVSTVTDDKGRFDFGDQAGFGDLVQTGGTDMATGAAVNGSYHAVAGSSVINPLTTLVAAVAAGGKVDAAAAAALVKARLGIDQSVDLGSYDPIAALNDAGSSAAAQATALQVQQVLAQVNTIMGQAGAALAGAGVAGGADGGANAAAAALSHMIQAGSAVLDLASAATAAAVLKDSAALAGASAAQQASVDAVASAAGTAVANLNAAIAGAAAAAGGTALSHLIAIAKVQLAAEAVEAAMTSGVHAGDVSASVTATTGAALATAIADAAAKVGDVNGDGRGDGPQVPAPGGSGPVPQPPAPTFMVNVDVASGAVSFSGTAHGNITFSIVNNALVFERGGLKGKPIDGTFHTLTLGSGQLLAVTSTQFGILDSKFDTAIQGPGAFTMTVDQPILAVSLNYIDTAGITVAVTHDAELDEGASLGNAAITVAAGATLTGQAGAFDGREVSGAGTLYLRGIGGDAVSLSNIAASVNVVALVPDESGLSGQDLGPVDQFELEGYAQMTAEQADGARLTAAPGANAFVYITGSPGSQSIDVSGVNYMVAGGGGADQITLGATSGTLKLAFGRAPVYQQQTLTLGGVYEAGDAVEGNLNGVHFKYTVTAGDLAQAKPMNAIAAKVAAAVEAADAANAVTTAVDASGMVTITANALNTAFFLSAAASNRAMTMQQDRITLSGAYEAGDTIHVSTSSYGDVTYTVTESDLTANGAAGDPAKVLANITSSLHTTLNTIFQANNVQQIADNVIVVSSNVAQTVVVSATNVPSVAAQAQVSTITPAGTYQAGDVLTISINDIPVKISVTGADLVGNVLANLAIKGAAALNQEFGSVLTASPLASGEITLVAKTAGTGFSVAAQASNYPGQGQQDTITLSGTYEAGDKIDVTFNGTAYSYTVTPDDLVGDANAQFAAIAAKLAPLLPGHSAQASGSVITIHDDAGPMTVGASASNRPAVAQQDSLTLAGTFTGGDTIQVFIDGTLVEMTVDVADVLSGAVLNNLAAKLFTKIAMTGGLQAEVQSVAGATITLAAKAAGTPYTLQASTFGPFHDAIASITTTNLVGNQAAGADTQVLTHENTLAYVAPGGDNTQQVSVSTPMPNQVEKSAGADTQAVAHETLTGFVPAGADVTQSIGSQVTVPVVAVAQPESSLAEMDVVTGFTVAKSGLMLFTSHGDNVIPTSLARLADVGSSNDLQATLAAAFDGKVAANAAAFVVINGGSAAGTYLYVNDDQAAYSATNDIFVKFVGIAGLGGVGELVPGAYFASED